MLPLTAEDPVTIGTYRLDRRLGSGGMGTVYLARDRSGARVAIKMIRPELALDPGFRARFADEVGHAQRVASFCTARVLERGELDGRPYLVTEFIEGRSLADYVTEQGPFSPEPLRALAIGIGIALTAIHAIRLIHRDLKPGNVLLSDSGPRVIDFGIARALDDPHHHTQTGLVVGSPGWIAPEQVFEGVATTAVDVFAWGSLVAYAATGRHPYGTGNLMVLAARAQQGQHHLTGVPEDLLPLVTAALDPDPAHRPKAEDILLTLVGVDDPQTAASAVLSKDWTPYAPHRHQPQTPLPPAVPSVTPGLAPIASLPPQPMPFPAPQAPPAPPHLAPTHPAPPQPKPRKTGRIVLIVVAVLVALGALGAVGVGVLYQATKPPVQYDIPSNYRGTWTGAGRYLDKHNAVQNFRIQMTLTSGPPHWEGSDKVGSVSLTADQDREVCSMNLIIGGDPSGHPDRVILDSGPSTETVGGGSVSHGGDDTGLGQLCDNVQSLVLHNDGTLTTQAVPSWNGTVPSTDTAQNMWSLTNIMKKTA